MTAFQQLAQRIREWRQDPVLMVRELFHVEPDHWQKESLHAFADPGEQRISMQACAGPGKTADLAWKGWNFLLCYGEPGHHPTGFAMSITADNLRDNLWKEMAVWRNRSPLLMELFEWTKQRIFAKDHPETWWLSARTFSKTADPEEQGRTLSGLHGKYILYLIDESGDIGRPVLRSAEQGLSNCQWGKIVQAGNPTSHSGMLYLASTEQSHLWKVIRITGDPEDPKRSQRIDIEWAREQIRLYGRDNPWVMAYILGQFPPSALNTLLGPDEVRDAMKRHLRTDQYDFVQKRLGIDVARFGDDSTVIFPRQGMAAFKPAEMRGARTDEIAARVMRARDKWGSEMEMIDDTGGWAGGVVDNCRLAGVDLYPINFSGKATDPRYLNKRAEMWFAMAAWIKAGGALPPVEALVAELTTPTYTFHQGRFQLEEKDQVKVKLGRSPNYADALALTFAIPDMPAQAMRQQQSRRNSSGVDFEYDPFTQQQEAVA
jgi:phage terminase large subunit